METKTLLKEALLALCGTGNEAVGAQQHHANDEAELLDAADAER